MKNGDLETIDRLRLEDVGIKATECESCKRGNYLFERVINAGGVRTASLYASFAGLNR